MNNIRIIKRINLQKDKEEQNTRNPVFFIFLIFLISVAAYGTFKIIQPYLHPIILGVILASLFHPLHTKNLSFCKNKKEIAAFLSVLQIATLVILPMILLTSTVVKDGIVFFKSTQEWVTSGKAETFAKSEKVQNIIKHPKIVKLKTFIENKIPKNYLKTIKIKDKLLNLIQTALKFSGSNIIPLLSASTSILFAFFIMLFVMYYIFIEGANILNYILHLSPLANSEEKQIIERVKKITKSAIIGTGLTSLSQALLAMIAFAIVGISPLFWGVILGFSSLIPMIGTALVWIPIVLYLICIAKIKLAIFLALWCIIVVGAADNFLRPLFMKGGTTMSSEIIFFAILGGVNLFGLKGIIYGPLIFEIFAVVLIIFESENHKLLLKQDSI